MEFPQELCQAELATLPGSRSGICRVGGAAQLPHPHPLRGAADPAATRSYYTPPYALPAGPGGGPPGLGALARLGPSPGGGDRAPSAGPEPSPSAGPVWRRRRPRSRLGELSMLGAGAQEPGSPRRLRGCGPAGGGRARQQPAPRFCFVLKPVWGMGSTLSMRNFLFARLGLQSFCPALELTSGSRLLESPRVYPAAAGARGGGGGGAGTETPGARRAGRRLPSRFPGAPVNDEPSGD